MVIEPPERSVRRRAGPIRRIKRWYRRLNYESASRPRTPWTLRVDLSLVLTGVLAFIVIWILQSAFQHVTDTKTVDYHARMINDSIVLSPVGSGTSGTGQNTVHVMLETARAGWPFRTATVYRDPLVSWSLSGMEDVVTRTTQPRTPLTDHVELAPQIRTALETSQDAGIRPFANGHQVDVDLLVFIIVTGTTWMFLWFLSLPLLGLIGFSEGVAGHVGSVRRQARRRQNRCEQCGYDLKGLDFTAACPECGALLT